MITDTMSKHEVMIQLLKEFDEDILPYYYKNIKPYLKKYYYLVVEEKIRLYHWDGKRD